MRISGQLIGIVVLLVTAALQGQNQPATAPGGRFGGRGSGAPVPRVARDAEPFTNSDPANINPALPTLFITGDSTATTGNPIQRGWAALLVDYFDTSRINLVNRAIGGARFNSYIGRTWDGVMADVKPGDYVVIEFGHNSGPLPGLGDETQETASRRGGPPQLLHTHGWYLKQFINDVRAKGGIPIASTITPRKKWADGKVERLKEQIVGAGGMSDWTRQVAANEKVLLVDHTNIIADEYDKLGQEAVAKFFNGTEYLHTNTTGAILNCETFVAGLRALPDAPFDQYLNEKGKAIEPYKPAKE